jgi:hypothetical protein
MSFIVPKVLFLWRSVFYPDSISGSTLRIRDWQAAPADVFYGGENTPR